MALLKAKEVMSYVRAALDYPSPETLKDATLLLKLQEKSEHYFNRLNLEERNWFLGSYDLNVSPSVETYSLPIPDWGRPITCETFDNSDPINHIRREVKLGDLQDFNLFYNGPVGSTSGTGTQGQYSAVFMATYRTTSNELKLRVVPIPAQTASYRIFYEPNRPTPVRLNGSIAFLEQFRGLLVADTALACLPYCRHEEPFNSGLMQSLMRDMQIYLKAFDEYVTQDVQQQAGPRRCWGDSNNSDWGWFF